MPVNSTEKWNKLCDYFELFYNKAEESIQSLWESIFAELFSYSRLDDEIETHRKIQLGSTERLIPDIIIKEKDKDLFIVELKREDLSIDESRKGQLFSYLKQTHNDIGILVADKIFLVNYDYNLSDDEQTGCLIEFTKDNPLGIKFIETFEKGSFSKDRARDFITECINKDKTVRSIEDQLTPELIRTILKDFFLKDCYESDINFVLNKYDFKIEEKGKSYIPMSSIKNLVTQPAKKYPTLPVEVSDYDRLVRDIKSVGKETFIKYFEYYKNPEITTGDIKELFRKYENFSPNSMASKASTGKGIVRRGMAKEALKIISEANISHELREQAKKYLSELD